MFGKSPFGTSSTATSAFGGSSLFGSTAAKPNVGFGSQTTAQTGSLFGQKPLFGSPATQSASIFGSTQPASTASSSLFGQPKPLFGSATGQTSAFSGTTSLFGSTPATGTSGGLFGSGFGATAPAGTTIKFEPPTATDTMLRNNTNQTITTKHMCITAMKQYESKSLEELRCEDYIANRRGVQSSGSLTFGQATQPSTSTGLFGSTATSTQSGSLFGQQNKPLFGTSASGFGSTTTTTSSLFGSAQQPTTTSSLFGSAKPTLGGGLFGSTATSTASPFGQTQPATTGLFGAKPTGFGAGSSLFGGTSAFGATTSTASPFSFSVNTQPATSGFSGFGQPASSTASTGLFGAKPAGFGGFSSATTAPFGTQPATGGLFGNRPATGGLFGSSTGGSLFGAPAATSSAPSLFGSTAAKPTTSLFGASVGQPGFGSAPVAASVVAAPAPIVLGADVSETLIQNALIEAQIAASPYGDSPLLKLVSQDSLQKAEMPNPASVERQMRFLAKRSGAVTTTTASGPSARGSIPAAGTRLSTPGSLKSRSSQVSEFSYRPVFSSPAVAGTLRINGASPIVSLNSTADRSTLLKQAGSDHGSSSLNSSATAAGDLSLQNPQAPSAKRLDLNLLHKLLKEGRSSSGGGMSMSTSNTSARVAERVSVDSAGIAKSKNASGDGRLAMSQGSAQVFPSETPIVDTLQAHEQRRVEVQSEQPPHLDFDDTSSSVKGAAMKDSPQQLNNGSFVSSSVQSTVVRKSPQQKHPAGIYLRRLDYECEPSLRELALMAERNGGVCHIDSGFTVRRLAFGSVFWPGPFDLCNVDLDEIVHFRQREVVVYPNDDQKPPVGEQLNRFAEISLERVWPIDRATKEFIKDPIRLEERGFRSKLERISLKMGAAFKDYRPDTGTWVFTVPHFTKYGLPDDSDDEEMPSVEQLQAARQDSHVQSGVQRARLRLARESDLHRGSESRRIAAAVVGVRPLSEILDDDLDDSEEMKGTDIVARTDFGCGLGGTSNKFRIEEDLKLDILVDGSRYSSKGSPLHPDSVDAASANFQKYDAELLSESKMLFDPGARLDELMESSEAMGKEEEPLETHITLKRVQPKHILNYTVDPSRSIFATDLKFKTGLIDEALFQGHRMRIGWGPGCFARTEFPGSYSVKLLRLHFPEDVPADYLVDMFEHTLRLSVRVPADSGAAIADRAFVQQAKPSTDYPQMIDSFIATSEQCSRIQELLIWNLCRALFTDPSHFSGVGVQTDDEVGKALARRDCIADWLRSAVTVGRRLEKSRSGTRRVLQMLTRGQLRAAVECAVHCKRPMLAMALATFQYSPREMYKKQIAHWTATDAKEFIDEDLLKVYLVMAGEASIEVHGRRIFVNDGLDWLSALGMFVWFISDDRTPLSGVLEAFERDVAERDARESVTFALPLELLKLACDRSHLLETVLDPLAFTDHPLDAHLSWHLWCVLRSVGYAHLAPDAEQSLHVSYAEQLTAMGLPHLALCVLSHIADDSRRQDAVLDLLTREAVSADDAMYAKFENVAKLPYAVIAHAKFLRALEAHDELHMCIYALECGMFDEAHSLFYERVAPSAVNLDHFEVLGKLCERFEANSSSISGWGPLGQIYTDFFRLRQYLQEIDDDAKVDELLDLANSLASRLTNVSADLPAQRLSVVKMSRLVYEMMSRFEGAQLSALPLSVDEALQVVSHSPLNVALL